MHVKCPIAWHFLAVEAKMKTFEMQRNIPVPIHNKWLIISSLYNLLAHILLSDQGVGAMR
jgi:hypothetical protein